MVNLNAWKHRLCIAFVLGAASLNTALAAPLLSMTAMPDSAVIGSTLGLDVSIAGIADLYDYQFTISFDPTLLQEINGTEGGFLATGGSTFFDAGAIDNAAGSISYTWGSLMDAVPGVSGSGLLAHFDFSVIGAGSSVFSLSDVLFQDATYADLAPQANSLAVQTVPEPSAYWLFGIAVGCLTVLRRRKIN